MLVKRIEGCQVLRSVVIPFLRDVAAWRQLVFQKGGRAATRNVRIEVSSDRWGQALLAP